MSNGLLISGGAEDMLYIFNNKLELQKEIDFKNELKEILKEKAIKKDKLEDIKINKITQNIIEKDIDNNSIQIIDCSKFGLFEYKINLNNKKENLKLLNSNKLACTSYFEINNKNENFKDNNDNNRKEYIVAGEKGLFHFDGSPFLSASLDSYNKSRISYKGSLKINDNYIAFTSNKVYPNGEDKLVIYDIKKKKFLKIKEKNEINGSFVGGINGLMLVDIEKNKKVILCGCKKYISEQKNGILTINIEITNDDNLEIISVNFYETENVEVNCFCQINKEDNNNFNNIYFFVGGFENEKGEGIMQLYRLVNDEDEDKYNIEYLQDININNKDFEQFERIINCIIQCKENGKILVNCFYGKIYCFSKPNIDYYLKDEESDISSLNI